MQSRAGDVQQRDSSMEVGRISTEEEAVLDALDHDGDGMISRDELARALRDQTISVSRGPSAKKSQKQ